MKNKFSHLWVIPVLLLSLTGCDNELVLTADWQDIPVVYGLIDINSDTGYVRVERVFFDENGSAFDAAANPDSIYYPNLTVRIQNMTTGQTATLKRVEGEEFGLERDPGVFAATPNVLYQLILNNLEMNGGDELRLILNRGNNLPPVTADAIVLEPITILGSLAPGVKLDFNTARETSFRWRAPAPDRIFDVNLSIRYVEQEIANPGNINTYQIDWKVGRNIRRAEGEVGITNVKVLGLAFYQVLRSSIPEKTGFRRYFQGIDLEVQGAGAALESYILISQANTGITSSQEIPLYSNLSDGLGIFTTSTRSKIENLQLTQQTLDSLRFSVVTGPLNFQ